MNLLRAVFVFFATSFKLSTAQLCPQPSPTPKLGIQVIGEDQQVCEDAIGNRGVFKASPANTVNQCALTVFPNKETASRYLSNIVYTFWKCGLGDIYGCTCGISRVVTVPAGGNWGVAMNDGEYLSQNACNAHCERDGQPGNAKDCWVCLEAASENGWINKFCKHKAEITPFMLGAPPSTKISCIKNCMKMEKLPYQYFKPE